MCVLKTPAVSVPLVVYQMSGGVGGESVAASQACDDSAHVVNSNTAYSESPGSCDTSGKSCEGHVIISESVDYD